MTPQTSVSVEEGIKVIQTEMAQTRLLSRLWDGIPLSMKNQEIYISG